MLDPVMTAIALPILTSTPEPRPDARPARRPERSDRRLIDSHGRTIRDLRISLTDRCNFRCVYCMEPDVRFAPHDQLLSQEEIIRIARIAASLGVRKIRLTGGEPTLRPDLLKIIAGIRSTCNVEIAMITNGSTLTPTVAQEWKAAGLERITMSIDTLRPDRFAQLTRSTTRPDDVLAGVQMCIDAGLTPVKLNAVLIRGFNDDEACDLAALARTFDIEMRFIEYMPLDSGHRWDASKWVSADETRSAIDQCFSLIPCDIEDASATARSYRFADGALGRIGFIAPVSTPFCGACSRLRLTADGKVRPCLFSTREWDIRSLLRDTISTDDDLAEFLMDVTWSKQAGHGISAPDFEQPARPMSAIGG